MRPIRLASRYAKALFEIATEQKIQDEVFHDMSMLADVCRTSREFKRMIQSPVIRFDKKNSVINAVFGTHFHKITIAYIDIINRKRREMILDEIAEQYITLYRQWKGIITAHFSTAVEVSGQVKENIRQMLSKQLNAQIELVTNVRPELIGGFLLSVEDRQLDASILRKIKKLTREFNVNIYERKI
jgi:F-type H+-transporting ATPase subunit delta